MKGFIGVHRKLMQNAVWTDPNYLKLWMYCMFTASHKQHEILIGNQKVLLERGQFVTGRQSLADDMNRGVKPKQRLNELTWFRYLKNLEKWEMLNIKSNNKFSVVTVDKYDYYQSSLKQTEHQTEQQMNIKRTTDEQQLNTNNNVNNVDKGKNEIKDTIPFVDIIDYLNLKAGKNYKPTGKKTKSLIKTRWDEKFQLEDFQTVIDKKVAEWNETEMEKYLRPETLFGPKFEGYLNQKTTDTKINIGTHNKKNDPFGGINVDE